SVPQLIRQFVIEQPLADTVIGAATLTVPVVGSSCNTMLLMLKFAASISTVEPATDHVMVGRLVPWPMPTMDTSVDVPRADHASAAPMVSVYPGRTYMKI